MKQLLSILLLSVITVTAYADKNSKPNKVQQVQAKAEQPAKPASNTFDSSYSIIRHNNHSYKA